MLSLLTFSSGPSTCSYLPEQDASIFYDLMAEVTPEEYLDRLRAGWRRFGYSLFRPQCPACQRCLSLRVPTAAFKPDRSQRRAIAANDGEITLVIGDPAITRAKLALYDRFHAFQHEHKGWPWHGRETSDAYRESFIHNPFPTEEWCYYLDRKLVGVGYVDALPGGLSAIYFYHDPDERDRSLGTYNVLCLLREATRRELPHLYLGYYVEGCGSLEYKARFRPNEVVGSDGVWRAFRK